MSETNNSGDKTLGAPAPKATLHLKRPIEQGMVRQSFSHGRSKAVVVEKVKRRSGPGEGSPREATSTQAAATSAAAAPKATIVLTPVAPRGPTVGLTPPPKTGVVLPTLTEEQREARARALNDARAREEEDRRRQEAEGKAKREREAREKAEREAAESRKREEELRRTQEANFKRQSEEEARRRLSGGEPSVAPTTTLGRKPGTIVGSATNSPSISVNTPSGPARLPAAEPD